MDRGPRIRGVQDGTPDSHLEFEFRGDMYVRTDKLFSVEGFFGGDPLDVINTETDERTILYRRDEGVYQGVCERIGALRKAGLHVPDPLEDTIGDLEVIKYRVPQTARPFENVVQSSTIVGQADRLTSAMKVYARRMPSDVLSAVSAHTLVVPETEEFITIPFINPRSERS